MRRTRSLGLLAALAASATLLVLPQTAVANAWEPTGLLSMAHRDHTATLLANGNVLAVGGDGYPSAPVLDDAELCNSTSGAITGTGSLNVARRYHTATLLQDGRVLVTSGLTPVDVKGVRSNTTELYTPDPAVLVAPLTAQYSDCVSLEATVTPSGLPGALAFLVADGTDGLLGSASYDPPSGAGSQGYRVWLPSGEYPIRASFSPEDTTTVTSGEATLTVFSETITVRPNPHNPTRVTVPWAGSPSGSFLLTATCAQERDGCYGPMTGVLLGCTLTPQKPRTAARATQESSYTRIVTLKGAAGPQPILASFVFKDIPAGAYDVRYEIYSGAYEGTAGGTLVVRQPPLVWQAWVEPAAAIYKLGATIKAAFLLKYGVATDQATLTVSGPGGVRIDHQPFAYDPVSGQHRFSTDGGATWGFSTIGWTRGNYALHVDVPNGTSHVKTIKIR